MLKVNNKDTKATPLTSTAQKMKFSIKNFSGRPGVFIVDFEYISYLFLVFPLLALNR